MRQTCLTARSGACNAALRTLSPLRLEGRVSGLSGLVVEVEGLSSHLSVGDRLTLQARDGRAVPAEIVAFRQGRAQAMPFAPLDGLGPGSPARACGEGLAIGGGGSLAVSDAWLGRVLDPLGRSLDGQGPLPPGPRTRKLRASPPHATDRARLGPPLDLGVRALNCFATCRDGQRLGLFAGSGVGKSTLLVMLARYTACDVAVLALVGERGREVREFMEDDLGPEGLARSVVVVATSDSPPLLRREAAYAAMTVAEHFRDQGKSVLLLMDSVTRFCLALREIGLSAGEPPATRGYPPSCFAKLPQLVERSGNAGAGGGSITAFYTVLTEGDDPQDPIADAARGILDGHIVLSRELAESGHFPAIDVEKSISRVMTSVAPRDHLAAARIARQALSKVTKARDLIQLGAYTPGSDPELDAAVKMSPKLTALLQQDMHERASMAESKHQLAKAITL